MYIPPHCFCHACARTNLFLSKFQAIKFLFRAFSLGAAEDDDGEDVSDEAENADDPHQDAVHEELEGVPVGPTLLRPNPPQLGQVEVVHEVGGQGGLGCNSIEILKRTTGCKTGPISGPNSVLEHSKFRRVSKLQT